MLPKSILVVEDNPSVADTLNFLLTIEKHQVEVVSDGATAIARFKGGGRYDLVITVLVMPGMDGLELARLIRARTPRQLVLLVTGFGESVSAEEKARLQHVDAVLAKPFSLKELNSALRAVFPHE